MPDSTLWAVIVGGGIGLASSIATGLVGGKYTLGAARVQSDAAMEQAELDHQRRDREHRQGVYHEFMNAVSRLNAAATMAEAASLRALAFNPDPTAELRTQFLMLLTRVRDQMNGILLFGTPPVTRAAAQLDPLLAGAERKVQSATLLGAVDIGGDDSGFAHALDAWESASAAPEWQTAMKNLRGAMREEAAGH